MRLARVLAVLAVIAASGAALAAPQGLIATYGHGSAVRVDASVPPQGCHVGLVQMLVRLADRYPNHLRVRVLALHSPAALEAMKPTGETCAGYVVDGSCEFAYTQADGTQRTASFLKSTEMGTYSAGELCAAVLTRLKEAGADVPGDPLDALAPTTWPNLVSAANSDPWLLANHQRVRAMEPRVLVLNFANGYGPEQVQGIVTKYADAIAEGSRYHGYADPAAPVFLRYQPMRVLDLRDNPVSAGRETKNGAAWPRDPAAKGRVDYSRFFAPEFTTLMDIRSEADPERALGLSELVELGLVNEVWFIGSHNEEDAAFEAVELKQVYDEQLEPVAGEYRQAGNGGDDRQPWLGRSLRIVWINPDRGIGCAMENLGHSLEGMANADVIPYFTRYFDEFAGLDLDKRYGLPVDSFYACDSGGKDQVEWLSPTSIRVNMGTESKVLEDYVAAGGNVHFPPNGRHHYDLTSPHRVMSTIESFRMRNGPDGNDLAREWSVEAFARYAETAPDCMGPWMVYWRQSMPGLDNACRDDDGEPMRNWWPFLFY